MGETGYTAEKKEGSVPIKMWTRGVPIEETAMQQLRNVATLPFIKSHIAVMPDVHWGMGATIGSVIATKGAIIPAVVGVDIGCGMMALQLNLSAKDLPDNLGAIRSSIEAAVPHGRTAGGKKADKGAWQDIPANVVESWNSLFAAAHMRMVERHPRTNAFSTARHLGTLGSGNHFIELCLDEDDRMWIMLHSGSRGPGNRIGMYFIEQAKKDMERWFVSLPDKNLAYIPQGSTLFKEYMSALHWAQSFALVNRELMMDQVLKAIRPHIPHFAIIFSAVNCHHNYVAWEYHFGDNVMVTRKGAVRAREGDLGIIPGSMGAKSFIVRGKGNPQSFHSCSHGAGRVMSRTEAKLRFTLDDHERATAGVECRKDDGVIDETPGAYKDIEAVMAAQDDLIEIVHTR